MPESLKFCIPSMYADDTEIYASAKDCDELVNIINCDPENVHKWMLLNKLQIHPKKTKYKFGLDHFGSDRIRILKFTNYRIGNFQSDPMHTFISYVSCDLNLIYIVSYVSGNLNLIYIPYDSNY